MPLNARDERKEAWERRDFNASISQNVWVYIEFTCSTQLELSSESTQTQYWVHVWVSPHKLNSVAMSWVQRGNSWVGCNSCLYLSLASHSWLSVTRCWKWHLMKGKVNFIYLTPVTLNKYACLKMPIEHKLPFHFWLKFLAICKEEAI